MQNKGGVEEEGLESKAGFCPTELGVSFFQVGLWESVQVRAVSGSLKGRGCALYPASESPDHI